jgi:hypothetical protein
VLQPALLESDRAVDVIGIYVGVEQLVATGGDAVAAVLSVRVNVGIGGLLGTIDRRWKAAGPC